MNLFETCVEKPSNKMLWVEEPYLFSRIYAVGDIIVRDHIEYRVLVCRLRDERIWTEVERTGKTY